MGRKKVRSLFPKIAAYGERLSALRFFVVCAVTFGLIFVVVKPPFESPDSTVHFLRAYQVSELQLRPEQVNGMTGGRLPSSLYDIERLTTTNPDIPFHPENKYPLRKTAQALHIRENPGRTMALDFSGTTAYSPVAYVPQALGIGVARLLRLPPLVMLYGARLANLATWTALFGVAISLMPRKKWALAAIGLLPTGLAEAASPSADVMTVGSTALFVALVLRLRESKRLSGRQCALLVLTALIMALSKQITFVLVPLVFLIPMRAYASRAQATVTRALSVGLPLLGALGWMFAVRGLKLANGYLHGQNTSVQTHFILHSPFSFVHILFNTYLFRWGDVVFSSFIGTTGWLDAPVAEWVTIVGFMSLAFLFLAHINGEQKRWLDARSKWLLAALAVVYCAAVSAALYVYYSPVQSGTVIGLQGRYFFPAALLFIPLLYGSWLKTSRRAYRIVALGAPVFLLCMSILTTFFRYYVHNM